MPHQPVLPFATHHTRRFRGANAADRGNWCATRPAATAASTAVPDRFLRKNVVGAMFVTALANFQRRKLEDGQITDVEADHAFREMPGHQRTDWPGGQNLVRYPKGSNGGVHRGPRPLPRKNVVRAMFVTALANF